MQRIDAIREILNNVTDECIITSTGMISREAYQVKDRDRNFYMQGSMGFALAIGIGLAYTRPDLRVIVISGDAACLMSLGTLYLHEYLNLSNLTHYILNNGCHASTGGQKTISNVFGIKRFYNTAMYKVSNEKGNAPRVPLSPIEIQRRFRASIRKPKEQKNSK